MFFSFGIYNYDLFWKTKYGDYRYEFPPQFILVLFGISFSVWLTNPVGESKYDDDYWESILWYIEHGDIIKVEKEMGCWKHSDGSQEYRLDERFLKKPFNNSLKQYRIDKKYN